MGQIFISYSRRDTEIVDRIAGQMKDAGLDVWVDREAIKAGNTWRLQIVEAIDTCLAFVLMLSTNSASSDNVRREIDLGQDIENPFLPIMLEPVKIPPEIRYQLAGQQIIDVQMVGFEKAVSQLIETIQEHIKQHQPAAEQDTRQVELVIQGINLKDLTAEKQEQLLDFLAQLSNSDRSKLQLAGLAPGSVHAFVNLPVPNAFELKTLALNKDERFKQFGIASLRLDGDKRFVNISLGILTTTATLNLFQTLWLRVPPRLRSPLRSNIGKFITILVTVLVLAGVGVVAAQYLRPPVSPLPSPAPIPSLSEATQGSIISDPSTTHTLPTETASSTPTATLTITPSSTYTSTATALSTETPTYEVFNGVVLAEQLACRYGPGAPYLYHYGLRKGNEVQALGRSDTGAGTWVYVQIDDRFCWINANPALVQLSGDVSSLELYYPEKVLLIPFNNPKFPSPNDVNAVRLKERSDRVNVSWKGFDLALGDREGPDRPLFLIEFWTCKGGDIVFTPMGSSNTYSEIMYIEIDDEANCSGLSHGRIYMSHKDGYVGPVEIPWPAHPTPTP